MPAAKKKAKTANKGGRPLAEIDAAQFQMLCKVQSTLEQIAGAFNVAEDTLERWCDRTYKAPFHVVRKRYAEAGLASLRQKQFARAMAGSDRMLIHLGKNYLGQKDVIEQLRSGPQEPQVWDLGVSAEGERLTLVFPA